MSDEQIWIVQHTPQGRMRAWLVGDDGKTSPERRISELEDLIDRGLRFAETCEWDKLEPPSFRSRAEVWIADARFVLSQRTLSR